MNVQDRQINIRYIVAVLLLALFLRLLAVFLLPQDYDEPIYLQTAFDYAKSLRAGDLNGVIDYPVGREHPALVKLIYAFGITSLGVKDSWTNAFFLSRTISAIWGTLAVLTVTILADPLSGGLLAVHTLAVKYTSQVYLEALPHFLSILAILAFVRSSKDQRDKWFWISAFCLGAAAASKFTYIPVVTVVLGYIFFFDKKIQIKWLVAYLLIALLTFFTFDVTLWHDPTNRLIEAISFHTMYSQGSHVQEIGYPWYQPFIWVFTSAPAEWHPEVFFYFGFDGLISILAVMAIKHEWNTRRWLVVWLSIGFIFLLLWPTKWPQYALTITPALCLMAAGSVIRILKWIKELNRYWDYSSLMLPSISKWLWGIIGAVIILIALLYSTAAIKLAFGRIGWSQFTTENSPIPSNFINDLLPGQNEEMFIATESGVAVWNRISEDGSTDGQWKIINKSNSKLPDNRVLSLARGKKDELWFGTKTGLAFFDGQKWAVFHAKDLKLKNEQINTLANGPDETIFIGTMDGIAQWDGTTWIPIAAYSGKAIFDLLFSDSRLWVATLNGIYSSDIKGQQLTFVPVRAPVTSLFLDSKKILWAATSDGLAKIVGKELEYFDTTNSGVPLNEITCISEDSAGKLWIGTSNSATSGGLLSSFDGKNWHTYGHDNSGFSTAEPVAIVASSDNRVWIGTRTNGLNIYTIGDDKNK